MNTETKYTSQLIEEIRNDIVSVRRKIFEATQGPGATFKGTLNNFEGLMTCALIGLHTTAKEARDLEIEREDGLFGEHVKFSSRGVGLDGNLRCFCCGVEHRHVGSNSYLNNIAAFVKSKEDGAKIVNWFNEGTNGVVVARLDFRPSEPNWIQVKVGACDTHLPQLNYLQQKTVVHGVIRKHDIAVARNIPL